MTTSAPRRSTRWTGSWRTRQRPWATGATGSGTIGVGRHTGLSGIADAIRADLERGRGTRAVTGPAVAVLDRIAQAPSGIRYVVEADGEAGLVIRIEDVPREWGWREDRVSPQLQDLADAVADLMNSYNRTGSDIGTRFFGVVRVGSDSLAW